MTPIHATVAPLDQLGQILPELLQSISIGRAQIAVDQLQSAIRQCSDQVMLVTAGPEKAPDQPPVAAVILLQPIDPDSGQRSESATLIHAGPLGTVDDSMTTNAAAKLLQIVHPLLVRRGVKFIQWATDPESDHTSSSITKWCDALGFDRVAELEYLHGPIIPQTPEIALPSKVGELDFRTIQWSGEDATLSDFANLVEQTYVDTLDCPRLAEFRSARQTLAGYQQSSSFDARLWFRVFVDGDESPVGCVILSSHQGDPSSGEGGVIELVYMGLVPQARGLGIGRAVLQHTVKIAADQGANRMIMAVDKKNHPAGNIYHDAGFRSMLSETVWVKSLR